VVKQYSLMLALDCDATGGETVLYTDRKKTPGGTKHTASKTNGGLLMFR
jgi:hypothetical protein